MADITFEHEGKSITVPLPEGYASPEDLKDKFVPKDFHSKRLADEAKRNLKRAVKREDIESNEDLKAELLEAWGVKPDGAGDTKTGAAELEAWKKQYGKEVETKQLKPLQTQISKLAAERDVFLKRSLHGELVQAAIAAKIDPTLVTGKSPLLLSAFESQIGYDEETGTFAARDGEGFAPSGKNGSLYKSVEEYLADWAADPAHKRFLVNETQGAPPGTAARSVQKGAQTPQDLISSGLAGLRKR
jgi:hypothetical protein